MVNLNRRNLQKHLKSGLKQVNPTRNVCMQWFYRVIECRYLEELQILVLIGKTIFCSSNLTEEIETALQQLQKHIEKYPQIEEMAKSSVELIDDSNKCCSEIDEAALNVGVSNRGKGTINCLDRHWDNIFVTSTTKQSYGTLPNESFLPGYFQKIQENKLGTVTRWTNVCLGNLQRFNSNYKYEIPKTVQRTIFTESLTSGQIEGYFANLKRNIGLKQPMSYFVKKSYQSLLWEQGRYFDGAVHGSMYMGLYMVGI